MAQDKAAAAPDNERTRMGRQLRAIRKAKALTLKQLSARAGVALSTLSKMELGQVSVSYEKFAAVARALEVDISRLFSAGQGEAPPSPVRASVTQSPDYDTGNYAYRLVAGDYPGRHMTPMYGRIKARRPEDFEDYVRHAGQEFIVVLTGTVRLRFETGETLTLKQHESAYFDSGVGHIYLSVGPRDAEILVVMAEPRG